MFNLDNLISDSDIETASKPETVRAGGIKRSQAQAFANQGGQAGFFVKAAQAWMANDSAPCMYIPTVALQPVLVAAVQMIDAEWPVQTGEKLSSLAMRTWHSAEIKDRGKGINALLGQLNGYRPDGFAVLGLRAFRASNGKIAIVIHEQTKRTKKLRERLGVSENAGDTEFDQAIAAQAQVEWDKLEGIADGSIDITPKKVTEEGIESVTVRKAHDKADADELERVRKLYAEKGDELPFDDDDYLIHTDDGELYTLEHSGDLVHRDDLVTS